MSLSALVPTQAWIQWMQRFFAGSKAGWKLKLNTNFRLKKDWAGPSLPSYFAQGQLWLRCDLRHVKCELQTAVLSQYKRIIFHTITLSFLRKIWI